jgi:hypothetical protein
LSLAQCDEARAVGITGLALHSRFRPCRLPVVFAGVLCVSTGFLAGDVRTRLAAIIHCGPLGVARDGMTIREKTHRVDREDRA